MGCEKICIGADPKFSLSELDNINTAQNNLTLLPYSFEFKEQLNLTVSCFKSRKKVLNNVGAGVTV